MDKDRAIVAAERENIYRCLAALCLSPPTDALISMIREGSILPPIADQASYMRQFVDQAREIGNLKVELEAEHTALFVLPSGVIPHESAYLDVGKRLGGSVTIGVAAFYKRAGATILDGSIEMPDHLGMELEFMGFLCGVERELWDMEECAALQKCIDLQMAFLEEHLLKWGFACCEDITDTAQYGFYKAMAQFAIEFLETEKNHFADLRTCFGEVGKGMGESSDDTVQAH